MDCLDATKSYEAWLAKQTRIVAADLRLKHQRMAAEIFSFMRATFYRWLELFAENCPDLCQAPLLLAVGDLHVENFGTWRDREGRLVWGINDFDESFELPYTNDLVRLATSAHLAISANHLDLRPSDACDVILRGYAKGLNEPRPFVLAEHHDWLRSTVAGELRDPVKFWDKLNSLPSIRTTARRKANKILTKALPSPKLIYRLVHRVAGLGSLGRQRYVALAEWNGAQIAREAKALVPSACVWFKKARATNSSYERIVDRAIRCPDPFLEVRKAWVVRRLAPDCSRVQLEMLPKGHDERQLLEAMGRETANIHVGSRAAVARVRRDLSKRQDGWLHNAAKTMVRATTEDWKRWKEIDSLNQ